MTHALLLIVCLLAGPTFAAPSVEVAFSPGQAQEAVVRVISEADRSIDVAAFSFTSKPIAAALIAASRRGVQVRAILDKSNETGRYSAATFLSRAGIPTRINSQYAIMHNKFIVVDGETVQTGSMNYSKAGGSANAENVLVLRENPDVAGKYLAEWDRLWGESRDYGGEAP